MKFLSRYSTTQWDWEQGGVREGGGGGGRFYCCVWASSILWQGMLFHYFSAVDSGEWLGVGECIIYRLSRQ